MVQASEIRDEETLKAWLEARPEATRQRDAATIAHRAAMRVLPQFVSRLRTDWAQSLDSTAIMLLRAALTSTAFAANPVPALRTAAQEACNRTNSAQQIVYERASAFSSREYAKALAAPASSITHSTVCTFVDASGAAAAAADATTFAADTTASLWVDHRMDAQLIETGATIDKLPLWLRAHAGSRQREVTSSTSIQVPDWFIEAWKAACSWLVSRNGHDFWIRWYEAALEGRPLTGDWESHDKLLTDIALIPDADWKQGAEHVAGLIEKIETQYQPSDAQKLADALPLAETVEVNPETGLFHTVPQPLSNAPLVGTVLSRVRDALDDALLGRNGITENAREARVITRVAARYGNDPQRIEMDFTDLAQGLRRQFESEELPRSEDNLALFGALEDGVRAIRATHPDVAANRNLLAAQAVAELGKEDRQLLEEAKPLLMAISDAALAEDFRDDIAEILAPRLPGAVRSEPGGKAPPLPGEVRTFSRVAKISMSQDFGAAIHKIDGSPTYKGARMIGTAKSLADLVLLGLRLFGVIP